ncbi:MAG: HAMP domain-containing sensor histidine kinase [Acidimicrobiales bacterium]
MSLRSRVLAGLALIAALLAVAAFLITRTTEAYLVDQVDARLTGLGDPLRELQDEGRPGRGGFDSHFPGANETRPLSPFWVGYLRDGAVETLLEPNLTPDGAPLPVVGAARAQGAAAAETGRPFTVESESSSLRYRVLASTDDRSGVPVLVGLPLDDVEAAVGRLIAVEVAATAAILAVLGVVGWWMIHLGIRPIKQMTLTAASVAGGELSHRVPEGDPRTEAGELGVALNRMLGRIEDAFAQRARSEDRLRRFVADASHELRTPVTTIRGYAELFRAGGLAETGDLAEAMRRTEQEAVRMGSLVDDLLHLARLDQGRPLEQDPVDLALLADDAVRDARAVDPDRSVSTDIDGALVVTGDEGRLRQVLANLLANSLVHTPAGTPMEVRLSRIDGRAVVEVVDRGPGMSEESASRAFERFYRADPSRSRHQGGSGLGLAIVQATVEAHGGEVSLRSAPGVGTTVRIELPLRAS